MASSLAEFFGSPIGAVGEAQNIAAAENRKAAQHEADLMKLMEEVQRQRAAEARNAELHPLEVQAKRQGLTRAELEQRKLRNDISLDELYRPREREANIGKTTADTEKTRQEITQEQILKFQDDWARFSALGPVDVEALAKQHGIDPKHPLIQTLKNLPPEKRDVMASKFASGGLKEREQRAREKAQHDRSVAVAKEQTRRAEAVAAARVRGQMAAAAAKNTDPKSIDARLLQIQREYNQTTDEIKRGELEGEFQMWQTIQNNRIKEPPASLGIGADGRPIITQGQRPTPTPLTPSRKGNTAGDSIEAQVRNAPPMPPAAQRQIGQAYKAPNGKVGIWLGDGQWEVLN